MIGPFTVGIKADNPMIKVVWRNHGAFIILTVYHIVVYLKSDRKYNHFKEILNNWKVYRVNSFTSSMWILCYIIGCSMTITSHAAILHSTGGVYMFVVGLLMCKSVHYFEKIGFAFI